MCLVHDGKQRSAQAMLKYPPLCPSRNFACDDLGALPPTTGCPRSTPPNAKRDIAGSTSSDCGRAPPSLALNRIMWGTLGLGGAPSCEVWGGSLCIAAVNVRRARFGRRGVRAIRDVSGCMLWARWAGTNMEGKSGIVHSLGDSPARRVLCVCSVAGGPWPQTIRQDWAVPVHPSGHLTVDDGWPIGFQRAGGWRAAPAPHVM